MELKDDSKEASDNLYNDITWAKIVDNPTEYDIKMFQDSADDSASYSYQRLNGAAAVVCSTGAGVTAKATAVTLPHPHISLLVCVLGILSTGATVAIVQITATNEQEKILRDKYNNFVKQFKNKTSLLKKQIQIWKKLTNQCMKEESKFKNNNFTFERCNDARKVVLMIGPTGYGKSTVCNRLTGNTEDTIDISEAKDCPFKVSEAGNIDPLTDRMNKKTWKTKISKDENSSVSFELSIIDTPGAFDTNNKDKQCFNKMMKKYFNACGGINLFCIFFKFGNRWDSKYDELLKEYQKFWGKHMWEYCCIIITNCDKDGKKAKGLKKGLPETKNKIKKYLNKISDNLCNDIKMYEFGEDNFAESTRDILLSLSNHNKKYMNKKVNHNINILWDKQKKQQQICQEIVDDAQNIKRELDACKLKLENFNKNKNPFIKKIANKTPFF